MSITVTAAASGANTFNGVLLQVKVLTNALPAASQTATPVSGTSANPPQIAVTPSATGNWIYGAACNENGSTDAAFTALASTTFSGNVSDATNFISQGTFRSTSTTTSGTPVTTGGSAPAKPCQICAIEILFSGTPGEDSSSPATANNQSGTSVTTASFTPPAGSLLLAQAVGHVSGANTLTMAVSDSSSLTWTELAHDSQGVTSVWVAQIAAAASGPVPYLSQYDGFF